MVGSYRDHQLMPDVEHKLDYGDRHFYAPQSFTDAQGRRIIFGWVQEGRSVEAQLASGWSGVMSLPRVLSLGPDGHVCMQPAPELAGAARRAHAQSQLSTCRPARSSLYRTSAATRWNCWSSWLPRARDSAASWCAARPTELSKPGSPTTPRCAS